VGIFPEGEDSLGDHGLGRLVEFRFKVHPGTTSPSITTHIIIGVPASEVGYTPAMTGGKCTKSTRTCGGIGPKKTFVE